MGLIVAIQHRLNMRVPEDLDLILREAAAQSGESLTGFVLAAAVARARDVIDQTRRLQVDDDQFARFVAALEEPEEDMPVLRRYAR